MRVVGKFDPSAATSGTIEVGVPDAGGKIVLYNRSLVNIKLDFEDGNTALLHAGEANYWTVDSYTPEISWSTFSTLNAATPAISEVSVVVYDANEKLDGTYPTSLIYQVNVANVGGVPSNVSSISNTGNPPGTSIIYVQPNDATGTTIQLDSAGNLLIKSDNAGVLTNLLQLVAGAGPEVIIAAASIVTQILGPATVGGTLTVLGSVQANNGSFYGTDSSNTIIQSTGSTGTGNTRIQNTDHISLQVPGGSEQIGINSTTTTISSTNVSITGTASFSHSITLVNGTLGQLKNFSGTGSGTFSSGITNPTSVALDPCTVSGSSQTIGATIVSSPVVTTGAGLAWGATAWHS